MLSRTTQWAVTHIEDKAYIPTKGHPTSASDMYRVVGHVETGHEGWNSCMTDIDTCLGLARVIEGEVTSWSDIQAAEVALQLLMWHDRVDIMLPGFKQITNGFSSYVRCDDNRTQLSFELFNPLKAYDSIYAIERVETKGGIILNSTYQDSAIVGHSIENVQADYLNKTPAQGNLFSSLAIDFSVPAYFSNPNLEANYHKTGYFNKLYETVSKDWNENKYKTPSIDFNLRLPPLLSIVLTRSKNRENMLDAIFDLREELKDSREEMLKLNAVLKGSRNEIELEQEAKRIMSSFESIYPASRYDGSRIIYPILKSFQFLKSPLEMMIQEFSPDYKASNPHVYVNRTVTGRMFKDLLVTDSMYNLIKQNFTKSEIKNLERSKI